jgi:hypothetical protein
MTRWLWLLREKGEKDMTKESRDEESDNKCGH